MNRLTEDNGEENGVGLLGRLKSLLSGETAAVPVDLSTLPKGDYRDVDARRKAARAKYGDTLADLAEFF